MAMAMATAAASSSSAAAPAASPAISKVMTAQPTAMDMAHMLQSATDKLKSVLMETTSVLDLLDEENAAHPIKVSLVQRDKVMDVQTRGQSGIC